MRTVLILVIGSILVAAGCAGGDGASGEGRTTVVAAFFPLAEAARLVAPAGVDVIDLTPPGAEPHDLELTADQVDDLLDADLVILLGGGFQPGVEDVAADRDGPTLDVFEALGIRSGDPHVWLDPTVMARIAGAVAGALDGDARRFVADLDALDERYASTLGGCERDLLVSSHEAFGHLAARYGLREKALTGLVPESEPDPATLDDLAGLIEREGVTTVFNEPLVPARAAATLAREAGVEVATLDPLESDRGVGYVEAMDANLVVLAAGLGCG